MTSFPTRFRCLYSEPLHTPSVSPSFYDHSVEQYALLPVEVLSLQQMLAFGRRALSDQSLVLKSARHVQRELPKRLARRLMDLQLLPYIVVTNPHIRKVECDVLVRLLPAIEHLCRLSSFC